MGKFSEGLLNDETILANLNIDAGQTILDAGCGNGYMAKKFSELVGNTGKIYALDPDRGSIDKLKNEIVKTNIEAFVGDITKPTGLKASSIDLVYLSTVFHIFSNAQIDGFVTEIKRILKPNAQLAIVNIKKKDTPFGPPIEMRTSPEELRQKIPFTPKILIDVGDHFYMQVFENLKIVKSNKANSADAKSRAAD
ncbi:MAG: class I SAM-dependent methyltransferase [Pseudomonadota bacterium]